jgi:hydroxymethylglutaryl-CoA synthase
VYATKAAARYLSTDGTDRVAIVVCSDVAEYGRGSTGEQTQGAGAVALLMEPRARLLELDLAHAGSGSAYRGPDFRKPHARHRIAGYASATRRLHDFPVFSGRYSTLAYVDEVMAAFDDMVRRAETPPLEMLSAARALFFHRPYHHMPIQALGYLYLRALLVADAERATVAELCAEAGVLPDALAAESRQAFDLFARVLAGQAETDPIPLTTSVVGVLRKTDAFRRLVSDKMALGAARTTELGNLYTAALFAWVAAGFEEAVERGLDLDRERVVLVGYGSGDAAEAIPARVAPG